MDVLSTKPEVGRFAASLFRLCDAYRENAMIVEAKGFSAVGIREREIEKFAINSKQVEEHRILTAEFKKQLLSRGAVNSFGKGEPGSRSDYVSALIAAAEVKNAEQITRLRNFPYLYDPCQRNFADWIIQTGGLQRDWLDRVRQLEIEAICNDAYRYKRAISTDAKRSLRTAVEEFLLATLKSRWNSVRGNRKNVVLWLSRPIRKNCHLCWAAQHAPMMPPILLPEERPDVAGVNRTLLDFRTWIEFADKPTMKSVSGPAQQTRLEVDYRTFSAGVGSYYAFSSLSGLATVVSAHAELLNIVQDEILLEFNKFVEQ